MQRETANLSISQLPVGALWNGSVGNYDNSRTPIDLIVIHTMVGTVKSAAARFANPNSMVSAHYGVGLDGSLYQWVKENQTAYHAGVYAINQHSIGIEHEDNGNYDDAKRTDAQYWASAELVANICIFYSIPCDKEHIIPHRQVKATRCPDGLDIDKIIMMAQGMIADAVTPKENMATDDEMRALEVLRNAFQTLKTKTGEAFGNIEGLTRELVADYPTYVEIVRPDVKGNPPVVIAHDHFVDITIKAQNFDTVSSYFGYTETNEVDPNLGSKIVDNIRLLTTDPKSQAQNTVSPATTPNSVSGLDTVFSSTDPSAPNSDQMTVSVSGKTNLIVSLLSKIASVYGALFLAPGGVKK